MLEFLEENNCVFIKSCGYFELWRAPPNLMVTFPTIGPEKMCDQFIFEDVIDKIKISAKFKKPG